MIVQLKLYKTVLLMEAMMTMVKLDLGKIAGLIYRPVRCPSFPRMPPNKTLQATTLGGG